MSKLSSVLSKIQKAHESAIRDPDEAGVVKRMFLDSPQLNFLFGGGFPRDRIIQFHGPESSGKSTLATYIAGQIQKQEEKNIVVYVDFERTFETTYAANLGLDTSPDKFIFLRPENGEEAFEILEELVRTGEIGLIIWDSDSTTATTAINSKDYGAATFGAVAKLFSDCLRKFNPLLDKFTTSLIIISQERDNVGALYGPDFKVTGGRAIKFYASNRSRITRTGYIKEKGIITGIEMKVKNGKNKAGIPCREAALTLMFDGGFDTNKEYIDFLILLNIVEQKGAYFKYDDGTYSFNLQGRAKLQDWLDTNPEAYTMFKEKVNRGLCTTTEMDADNTELYNADGDLLPKENEKEAAVIVDKKSAEDAAAMLAAEALLTGSAEDAAMEEDEGDIDG